MTAVMRVIRGENHIEFPRWWRYGLMFSAVLVVLSIGSFFVRGLNLSVEFTGGVSVEAEAPGVSAEQARQAVADAGVQNAKVQIVGSDIVRVQTSAETDEAKDVLRTTMAELAGSDVQAISVSAVSPSWGDDITGQAVRALVFFLIAILAYLTIRLELKMAVGAIVAVVHDIIISVGVYSVFQFEVSPGTVIAFLTILGYSIYDTVVVYDKVKENEARAGLTGKLTYTDMVALSMNQVLLRSLNTTITSLIPVVSLLVVGAGFLGAVALGQFGIALFVGLLVGAYSSIMVAAPVVALLKEREPHFRAVREKLEATGGRAATIGHPRGGSSPVVAGAPPDSDVPGWAEGEGPERPAARRDVLRQPAGAIPPRPRKQGKKR